MPFIVPSDIPEGTLDPQPTLFGISGVDALPSADGSTELSRATLWLTNRARRFAYLAQVQVGLIGNPIAAQNLRARYQPLLDYLTDMTGPDWPGDEETEPVSNVSAMP